MASRALPVRPILTGGHQIVSEKTQGFACQAVGERVLLVLAGVGFDRVNHRIDPGGSGVDLRQADSQLSVEEHEVRVKLGETTPIFVVSPVVMIEMLVTSEPVRQSSVSAPKVRAIP